MTTECCTTVVAGVAVAEVAAEGLRRRGSVRLRPRGPAKYGLPVRSTATTPGVWLPTPPHPSSNLDGGFAHLFPGDPSEALPEPVRREREEEPQLVVPALPACLASAFLEREMEEERERAKRELERKAERRRREAEWLEKVTLADMEYKQATMLEGPVQHPVSPIPMPDLRRDRMGHLMRIAAHVPSNTELCQNIRTHLRTGSVSAPREVFRAFRVCRDSYGPGPLAQWTGPPLPTCLRVLLPVEARARTGTIECDVCAECGLSSSCSPAAPSTGDNTPVLPSPASVVVPTPCDVDVAVARLSGVKRRADTEPLAKRPRDRLAGLRIGDVQLRPVA
eukprot:TRINITY_DN7171_c0_g1_i1.p1 TRINITY_DN7171_c0_g1~~TRINITY_DN7171_c0_g1_i1.p1  ORF type:complete len:336 (+),score=91.42 TRINITY_DN7171_c0_g1_i1:209-1216(+)